MGRALGLTKIEQGKILTYVTMKTSVPAIAKAINRSKNVVLAFVKDPDTYGTKKSTG